MKQEEDKQDRRVGYIGRLERMKDELQGSITSERTKWGCPRIIFRLHTKNFVPNDGTGGRGHPQLGCILKTLFPFARGITSGFAGVFCRSRTRFDSFFKFPFFCLFFMFLYFQLCAVCELYVSRSDSVSAGILPSGTLVEYFWVGGE